MKEKKVYLVLDGNEKRILMLSLVEFRNRLIQNNGDSYIVDEIIEKVSKVKAAFW
ncbi:MAG: hypothetical protein J6J15_01135 [Oscillospiraceae bacterium]|nr:hypothetical protein [Oscillospiraceae bacterium]